MLLPKCSLSLLNFSVFFLISLMGVLNFDYQFVFVLCLLHLSLAQKLNSLEPQLTQSEIFVPDWPSQ